MKTKEEILLEHGIDIAEFDEYERIEDCLFINKSHAQLLDIKKAMQDYAIEYATSQTEAKEKEIELLKKKIKDLKGDIEELEQTNNNY